MNLSDWIGFAGVSLLLIAYFLQTSGKLASDGRPYLWMNFLGAAVACFASWLIHYWPFVLLEGAWALVSLQSLWKVSR